jgi:dTDP-4-amino-4,6-dideoxygalactose transaminase
MSSVLDQVWIALSDPDMTAVELRAVAEALQAPQLTAGPAVDAFEREFGAYVGRRHAVAVASGTLGLLLALRAHGIGPGDEVILSPHGWRETGHAVALAGAVPVFSEIDYWAGTLMPDKAATRITGRTRAIVAANTNGHPAPWAELRALAASRGLVLLEDSTEAIGSVYQGRRVGSFGDCAVFDLSQPGAITCGEGGMVLTDDDDIAFALRRHRARRPEERGSVVLGMAPPAQAGMSEIAAALGRTQLGRIDAILAKRKLVESLYYEYVQSFEGIKDPYVAPEVEEVHWFLYVVHLGTRFSRSSRDAIVDDLRTEHVEATAYSVPLHLQPFYFEQGWRRGSLPVTDRVSDRAVALPFHAHLSADQVEFVVGTMKDASVNVGAGSAIY